MRPPSTPHKRSKPKRAKKRAPTKRLAKKSAKKKRSAAAKKGWETRRKKQRLLKAMADLRMKRAEGDAQPPGWIERREDVRQINGELWREIAVEFSETELTRIRLATLEELEIDLLPRDDLADYLGWLAEETDTDLSDMYRMYLGYPVTGD